LENLDRERFDTRLDGVFAVIQALGEQNQALRAQVATLQETVDRFRRQLGQNSRILQRSRRGGARDCR
jgi:prefoldin subunit 5